MNDDGRYECGVLTGDVSPDGTDILLAVDGGDWQMKEVADALKHLTALPKTLKQKYEGQLHVPLTWAVVTQCARLAEQRGFKWGPEPRLNQWIVDEFTRRFTEEGDLKFDLSSLSRIPMAHQAGGAFVGALNERFFFADDMGTGKTFTALLTLAELSAQGKDPFPAFVVCPASVVDPWLEELQECFPDWQATAYQGPKRKLLSARYKIYVMSWDVFRLDMQQPKDEYGNEIKSALPPLIDFLAPRTLILDEAHALCNVKTKQSIAARKCARVARYAFPMSGTPITKDVGGFWSALNVLDIRSFPSQDRYRDRYTDRHSTGYGQDEVEGLTSVNREEFHTLTQGSMRRIAKADVLTDLPPKMYTTRVVELPAAYRTAYLEMQEDMIAHLPDSDEPLPVMSTLAQLQRLSQLASSACDVKIEMRLDEKEASPTFGLEVPHYNVTMKEPSWKVDELMAIMHENEGEPIVTFAPHTQLIQIAGARAEREGFRVGYIKGGQTKAARTRIRRAFQNGELDLLCANTAAGGVGLTLTRSNTLVYLERPWSFVQSAQSEDRIHRRGQDRQAHIIDIVAADTIESRVREALKSKAQQLSDLVRDPRIVKELLGGQELRVSSRKRKS
jgi:SNF2 family DNA or RNA helicase